MKQSHRQNAQVWHALSRDHTVLLTTHAFIYERNEPYFCLPSWSWSSFTGLSFQNHCNMSEIIIVRDGFFVIAYMVYTWFCRWRYIQCLCLGLVLSFTVFIVLTICLSVMYFVYNFIINNKIIKRVFLVTKYQIIITKRSAESTIVPKLAYLPGRGNDWLTHAADS